MLKSPSTQNFNLINERRQIEMFFNKDYFPELDKYNDMCSKCKEKCKQPYWADILDCRKYKKN